VWVCTRKYFFPQKSEGWGVKIPCLTADVNFWGSFDRPEPTVPVPLMTNCSSQCHLAANRNHS